MRVVHGRLWHLLQELEQIRLDKNLSPFLVGPLHQKWVLRQHLILELVHLFLDDLLLVSHANSAGVTLFQVKP